MKLFIDAENQILKWSANRVFFTTLVKKKKISQQSLQSISYREYQA